MAKSMSSDQLHDFATGKVEKPKGAEAKQQAKRQAKRGAAGAAGGKKKPAMMHKMPGGKMMKDSAMPMMPDALKM